MKSCRYLYIDKVFEIFIYKAHYSMKGIMIARFIKMNECEVDDVRMNELNERGVDTVMMN